MDVETKLFFQLYLIIRKNLRPGGFRCSELDERKAPWQTIIQPIEFALLDPQLLYLKCQHAILEILVLQHAFGCYIADDRKG